MLDTNSTTYENRADVRNTKSEDTFSPTYKNKVSGLHIFKKSDYADIDVIENL